MDMHHLYRLLEKYRNHQCNAQEKKALEDWYDQFDEEAEQIGVVPKEKLDGLYFQIQQKIGQQSRKKNLRLKIWKITAIAASLVLLLGGGYYFSLNTIKRSQKSEITPGRYQAELVLSDGSRITLDSNTVVTEKDGALLKDSTQAVLDYSRLGSEKAQGMNTIVVPKGGEYSLILADGSQVWLNSGSSLKYPMAFGKEVREVVLTGEGFFKVTKSDTPFVVKAPRLDIRVLGTSFDVSAYEEDKKVTTALVTGQVEVCGEQFARVCRITPGEVFTYTKESGEVSVEKCDTELYTSWMAGEFKFRNMRLEEIMVKLNRWYNCEVVYEEPLLKELRFSGAAEKDRPVSYLLEMIESITNVRFRIEGNKIRVASK